MRPGSDKAFLLQAPEQAARQAEIGAEILADFSHIRATRANRVQDAGGPKRPAPAKEGGVQRTDLHGDGASETTKACYRIVQHII